MTLSLWKRESERATEATGAEDQCDASAVRQVWGRVNSDPLRLELRMFVRVFGGCSGVGERMSCKRGFQVESVPVDSQISRS
jgi:hypothetical protein